MAGVFANARNIAQSHGLARIGLAVGTLITMSFWINSAVRGRGGPGSFGAILARAVPWTLDRIWSIDLFRNPKLELDRLVNHVQRLLMRTLQRIIRPDSVEGVSTINPTSERMTATLRRISVQKTALFFLIFSGFEFLLLDQHSNCKLEPSFEGQIEKDLRSNRINAVRAESVPNSGWRPV